MADGMVFDIQRFCVHDGPGIRTTVFLKGCPLACQWCHNPEGRDREPKVRYFASKCLGCGRCTAYTGQPPEALAGKEALTQEIMAAEHCPAGALSVCGRRYTSSQLLDVIERDRDFYGASGGVTFSGGEPAVWPEFLEEMLLLCRERGIHTAIDTCGYAPRKSYERVLPLCGLILFDIKGIDPAAHRRYTGKDNGPILDNFRLAADSGKPLWVRVPLIAGLSAGEAEIEGIADFLMPYRQAVQRVTLIPYHSFGNAKYATLNLVPREFPQQDDDTVHRLEEILIRRGFSLQH